MHFQKYVLVTVLLTSLVVPHDAWLFSRRDVRNVLGFFCNALFGLACPIGVQALFNNQNFQNRNAITDYLRNKGLTLGQTGCTIVQTKWCKRSVTTVPDGMELISFSDNFEDYDCNGDKQIQYHEFERALAAFVPLVDPDQLMEPFVFADADGNDMIDMDEFLGAPFMFAHVSMKTNNTTILPNGESMTYNCTEILP